VLNGHCEVLFADGSVQQMNADRFDALSQRGLVQLATPQEIAMHQQQAAIAGSQLANAPGAMPATTASAGSAAAGEPGSFSGTGGFVAGVPAAPPVTPAPLAAGIRSLRIELPQTGRPFLFTKVLNVREEPLSIRANIMTMRAFQTIQMAWQSAAFLLGLAAWIWQWRREHRNTF